MVNKVLVVENFRPDSFATYAPFIWRIVQIVVSEWEGDPPSQVNFIWEKRCPLCPSKELTTALAYALSRAGRAKTFIWRNFGPARRMTLPSKKGTLDEGHPSSWGNFFSLVPTIDSWDTVPIREQKLSATVTQSLPPAWQAAVSFFG